MIRADATAIQTQVTITTDRCIPDGSLVWEGCLSQWSSAFSQRIMEVLTVTRAKDLKGRNIRYEYGLAFYKGSLPAVDS